MPLLEARKLLCTRGEVTLFEDLSLALHSGEALQIRGANGCGKTSLLRILAGLTPPEDGEVLWCGANIREGRTEFHARLAYLGHHLGLKAELTIRENLRIALGIRGRETKERLDDVLELVGLEQRAELAVRALSAGQRQRVALARLLLSDARLWILDEPFTALDSAGIAAVQGLAESHLRQGGGVILTSHQLVSLGGRPPRRLDLS